ncbi:hypothetical protein CYMTET_3838 [Cymbomonas tetramitiformis]|uniref:EGF-like domain-containing protein n=1 Tax=Cymbomonas tetramitiformis TaxID=36881 RepID=A0AAE0LKZ4_9CHLO|nr:hypothetical protein CYMTET_3838 [Cymbomonas tetramitiformis]|eukprot:gene20285-24290_t
MPITLSGLTTFLSAIMCALLPGLYAALTPCTPECKPPYGSCNLELGRCDCKYGYGGDGCTQPLIPSCTLAGGGVRPCTIVDVPTSCACKRECSKTFWDARGIPNVEDCFDNSPGCFMPEGTSTLPIPTLGAVLYRIPSEHPPVTECFNRSVYERTASLETVDRTLHRLSEEEVKVGTKGWLPAESCNGTLKECSGNGICSSDKELRCRCFKGYSGAACDVEIESWCFNMCSGHGQCATGTCICEEGFFGMDCSIARADEDEEPQRVVPTPLPREPYAHLLYEPPSERVPHQRQTTVLDDGPHIYVYNLPPRFNTWHLANGAPEEQFAHRSRYGSPPEVHHVGEGFSESAFTEYVLRTRFRTLDPSKADFFLVPVLLPALKSPSEGL